jgi:peptidoglycan/xylan/chitin deacetylase (PgdA/CDA1 family)
MSGAESFRPNPVRQALRSALIGMVPRTRLIASLPAADNTLALTFDDGPHPEWTPRILDVLAQHAVRASFFVVGARAAMHPALVQRIAAEGHAVGHHSWSHSEPSETPARQLLAENRRTRQLLEDLLQRPAPLFRPPHGKLTPMKLLGAWAQHDVVVLWNCDPKDYTMSDPSGLRTWATSHTLAAGSIVLLHDTSAATAAALPDLLTGSALRFVALETP